MYVHRFYHWNLANSIEPNKESPNRKQQQENILKARQDMHSGTRHVEKAA